MANAGSAAAAEEPEPERESPIVMVHRQYGEQMLLLPIRVEGTECTYSTTMMFDEEGARLPNTYTMKELGLSEDLFLRLFEVYSVIVKGLGGSRLHEEVQAIKAKIVEAAAPSVDRKK